MSEIWMSIEVGGTLPKKKVSELLTCIKEEGLLHLIDDIQDQAAETLGEKVVFGKL